MAISYAVKKPLTHAKTGSQEQLLTVEAMDSLQLKGLDIGPAWSYVCGRSTSLVLWKFFPNHRPLELYRDSGTPLK